MVVDGFEFPHGTTELNGHLWLAFRAGEGNVVERTPEQRFFNLKSAIDLAFNGPNSIRRVIWNEWTELILRSLIGDWDKKRFLGLAGCSSSGKSDTVALYGLMSYWARPAETYFIVMSTTKQAARGRIWKSITQYWGQAERMGCPGKLIDSDGYIKGVDALGRLTRNSGIILMAAGKQDAEEASKELLGLKNPNFLVAADEFNELGDGILKTAAENLIVNDRLCFCAMANPDKLTDPFGELCEPADGWKSVTEDDRRWKTKYGICIRLVAEESPRIAEEDTFTDEDRAAGRVAKCYWQPDRAYCDLIASKRGGKKSRGYYRFVKAFWAPDGAANSIYSEIEFLNSVGLETKEPNWDGPTITLTGCDPSFSRFGDRTMAVYARLGQVDGVDRLHFFHEARIEEDINDKSVAPSFQAVRQWKKWSGEFGAEARHAAHDNTGAGTPWGHIVDMEWSPAVQKVNFQGKASDRTVVFRNEDVGFYNKNSELWIQGKELLRGNQISGISKEAMSEMVEREYHEKEGRTLRVESKEEAKKRLKKSPDLADGYWLVLEKAITLGRMRSQEVRKVAGMANQGWTKAYEKKQVATACGRKMRRGH